MIYMPSYEPHQGKANRPHGLQRCWQQLQSFVYHHKKIPIALSLLSLAASLIARLTLFFFVWNTSTHLTKTHSMPLSNSFVLVSGIQRIFGVLGLPPNKKYLKLHDIYISLELWQPSSVHLTMHADDRL